MTGVLFGICAVLAVMVVALAFLGWSINREISDQYEEIKELRNYVANVNRRLTTLEHKSDKKCDRVEIVHKYDDSGAPRYGGF
jgi:sensor domain CHASE-containing protein